MASRESAAQIAKDSSEWITRIDRGLSSEEQAAFDQWVAADPRHVGGLARAQSLWVHASRVRVLGSSAQQQPRPSRPLSWAKWSGAAGVLATVLVASVALQRYTATHFHTALGEIRRISLTDGSAVTLDTQSRIVMDYSAHARQIRLESGEALFEVAHDATRPFIVEAGALRVRAVGTAFMVSHDAHSKIHVTVTRGVVDVWRQTSVAEPAIRLGVDRSITATTGTVGSVVRLSEVQMQQAMTWRDGIVDLQGRTLAAAADEFNRYNEQKLVIVDPLLANQAVVGRFQTSDPRAFAQAAAAMLDAQVRTEHDRIVLERRPLP